MGKAPAFQFYPGDWMQDTRPLSLSAKGAWIDLLCAMWRSQTRGMLSLPWHGYARLIGATVDQTKAVVSELIDMGICDAEIGGENVTCNANVTECNKNVTLINRRMYREQKERESTRLRVSKYRSNKTCNDDITVPSSSSSSSSCTKVHSSCRTLNGDAVRLSEFLLKKILERNPNFKPPIIQSWARQIDLMLRVDKRAPEHIERIITLCQEDEFWQNNILSTTKLRAKFDQLNMKLGGSHDRFNW